METISDDLLRVTSDMGKIKKIDELETYFNSLSDTLKANTLVNGLFKKRKNWIKDMLAKLDPNNCDRCGMMLGYDENDRKICYMCRF